jgi:hypothetical protein
MPALPCLATGSGGATRGQKTINVVVPTVKGKISVSLNQASATHFILSLSSPPGTTATVGVPRMGMTSPTITANGTTIYAGRRGSGREDGRTRRARPGFERGPVPFVSRNQAPVLAGPCHAASRRCRAGRSDAGCWPNPAGGLPRSMPQRAWRATAGVRFAPTPAAGPAGSLPGPRYCITLNSCGLNGIRRRRP